MLKIYFIDGVELPNGEMVTCRGMWRCLGYYRRAEHIRLAGYNKPKTIESRIVVARQKTRLKTLCVLGHEVAHWLVDKFFCRSTRNKFDKWLDRK